MTNEHLNKDTLPEKNEDESKNETIGMKWDDERKAYYPDIDDEFIYRFILNHIKS